MEAVTAWAKENSDIRALGLAGSWARGTARADSDLDLVILANTPQRYRSDHAWLSEIKLPEPFRVVTHREAIYGVVWSCHVLLDPAAELELAFSHLDWASTGPVDPGTQKVVGEGFQVIVDKDGCLQRLVVAIARSRPGA